MPLGPRNIPLRPSLLGPIPSYMLAPPYRPSSHRWRPCILSITSTSSLPPTRSIKDSTLLSMPAPSVVDKNKSLMLAADVLGSDMPSCIRSMTVLLESPTNSDMALTSLAAAFTFIVTCFPGDPSGITDETVFIQRSTSSSVSGSRVAFSSRG